MIFSPFKGRPVPLILPSFQPLPFLSLFAIFIPSVFEVVQVGQVVQPRQPWLCAVPPEKCQPEKWDSISNGCPTLYHLFLRHARLHSDTEDAGGESVDPGFADLRQADL